MTLQRMEHAGAAPQTTLATQIGAGDLTIPLVSGAGYPTGVVGPFVIVVDPGQAGEEKIRCSSRSGNSCTVATAGRGYDGTTAGIHTQNAPVQHVLAAIEVDDDNEHIYNQARDDHTFYARADGTRPFSGGITINAGGATVTGNVGVTGNVTATGAVSASGAVTGQTVVASGLTGATAASRHVGATASGAPISGTFAAGDYIVDQSGPIIVCTAAGSPGTWSKQALDALVMHLAGTETVTGAKTFSAALVGQSSITGQSVAASGLTGAVAASRYVGATASGAPTVGTFAAGDYVIDQTGFVYVCTTAGTPGTWRSTPGGTLGYAQITAASPNIGATPTVVAGLSVTIAQTAGRRLRLTANGPLGSAGAVYPTTCHLAIYQSTTTQLTNALSVFPTAANEGTVAQVILPNVSAGSVTYNVFIWADSGTTAVNPATNNPAFLLVEDIGI